MKLPEQTGDRTMPVSFKFTSNQDNKTTDLSVIDQEMCNFLDVECDEKKFHPVYNLTVDFGIAVCYDKNKITKTSFNAYITKAKKRVAEAGGPSLDPKLEELLRKFLYQDYTFSAWR